jgi:hypothetical protein
VVADILNAFMEETTPLNAAQIKWLRASRVSTAALMKDQGETGYCLSAAAVFFEPRNLFSFASEAAGEETVQAIVFVARDDFGTECDLVAWAPKSGGIAAWLGVASMLGATNALAPRLGDECLDVHLSPLEWLRADRAGVVIVDPLKARPILECASPIRAASVRAGLSLRRHPNCPRKACCMSYGTDIRLDDAIPIHHIDLPRRSDWTNPKPLPDGLKAVLAFDPAFLPAALGPWVDDISTRLQCPPDFVAISAMVALGSTIGAKIGIKPQMRTDWVEVANLWGMIVGRPGAMKSPAMNDALKPLNRMESEAREAGDEALRTYELELESFKLQKGELEKTTRKATSIAAGASILGSMSIPERPPIRRLIVHDASFEKLGEILADNPDGVLAYRDEIISLLKTLEAPEAAAARGFYLSAWGGLGSYQFDRIVRGRTHIRNTCLSLLGSTQPGRLAEYLGRALRGGEGDDGLIQRFSLLVWPDGGDSWRDIDAPPNSDYRRAAWDCFKYLHELDPAAIGAQTDEYCSVPYLHFDPEALEIFLDWRTRLEGRLKAREMHPALESHLSKYRKLMPSLALISHLADGGAGPVNAVAVDRAEAFTVYLESHAQRAYGSGLEQEASVARAIVKRIRQGDLIDGFTSRDLRRNDWSSLTNIEANKAALELLCDLDWLRDSQISTGGRPKTVYAINPRVTK